MQDTRTSFSLPAIFRSSQRPEVLLLWQNAHTFLCHRPKFLGITGDSLTFAASLLLALEALFKLAELVSKSRIRAIADHFKYAEDAAGKKLNPDDLREKSQIRLAEFLERQRAELEQTGGGNRVGMVAEWDAGWAVAWDVRIKPQFRIPWAPTIASKS